MQIPSFEQFLADMGPDFLKIATEKAVGDQAQSPDPSSLIAISNLITVEILADYHAWLVRQLAGS